MTIAANAIISVAEAKDYIKLVGTSDDTKIETIINGVSKAFENYCGTNFINGSISEIQNGDGSNSIILKNRQVVSVTSIAIRDNNPQSVSDYYIDLAAGIIQAKYIAFPNDFQNITIVYVQGYG